MSTKIYGVIPHAFTSYDQIKRLSEQLRPALDSVVRLDRAYGSPTKPEVVGAAWHIGPWAWPDDSPVEEWKAGRGPAIRAPLPDYYVIRLAFGRHCLSVHTGIKWWAAMHERELLYMTCDCLRTVVRSLGSNAFLLYRENDLVEDWVFQGLSFDEIERRIASGGAPAVPDIDALPESNLEIPKAVSKTGYYRESLTQPYRA